MIVPPISYPVKITKTLPKGGSQVRSAFVIADSKGKLLAHAYDYAMAEYICTRLNAVNTA